MPPTIPSPKLQIPLEPLTPAFFAPYGTVIENPARYPNHTTTLESITANQGSATKYLDVTHVTDYYSLAPSRQNAKAVMNMFVCAPRKLRDAAVTINPTSAGTKVGSKKQLFDVKILERHPFTSQTFIPIGLSAEDKETRYLVIVAPTLPVSRDRKAQARPPPFPEPALRPKRNLLDMFSRARPSPFTNSTDPPVSSRDAKGPPKRPKGPGLPDLTGLKAFIANGNQAVTYAAGTWHAPMAVLGKDAVDFVVVQFANGVGLEDCQEVLLGQEGEGGIVVELDIVGGVVVEGGGTVRAKL